MRSGKATNNNAEVNLEIQFNMNDDSFKIVHGRFGNNFPDRLNNTNLCFIIISPESVKTSLVQLRRRYLCML